MVEGGGEGLAVTYISSLLEELGPLQRGAAGDVPATCRQCEHGVGVPRVAKRRTVVGCHVAKGV